MTRAQFPAAAVAAFCRAAAAKLRAEEPTSAAAIAYERVAEHGGKVPVTSSYRTLANVVAAGLAAVLAGRPFEGDRWYNTAQCPECGADLTCEDAVALVTVPLADETSLVIPTRLALYAKGQAGYPRVARLVDVKDLAANGYCRAVETHCCAADLDGHRVQD